MTIRQRIEAFVILAKFLAQFNGNKSNDPDLKEINKKYYVKFEELIKTIHFTNPWFTEEFIRLAVNSISKSLSREKIENWLKKYPGLYNSNDEPLKKIGVILAGNIPLVGLHDFISVLITGNIFKGKLSSKDDKLLVFIADLLIDINKELGNRIFFTENKLTGFEAIIATGSNNSARYFEYYFNKYPNIIRKNRNALAVLTGDETVDELKHLGNDIFSYFGLGCRNVSKLFVPENYNFNDFFKAIEKYNHLFVHHKYANNYDYNRTVYLLNREHHLDNGFVLLKENEGIASPIGVIYYQFYISLAQVNEYLRINRDKIQCIVSSGNAIANAVKPGQAQFPKLWDYADGADTVQFLINL